jgi:hypothetical protein
MMIGSVVGAVVGDTSATGVAVGGSAGSVSVVTGSPAAGTAVGEGAMLRGRGALHANTDKTNIHVTTDNGLRITILLSTQECSTTPAHPNVTPS